MPRDLTMISICLDPVALHHIRQLTPAQTKKLLDAYPLEITNTRTRSAIIRALIECGLDLLTNSPHLTALESDRCRLLTTPRLLTSDVPGTGSSAPQPLKP